MTRGRATLLAGWTYVVWAVCLVAAALAAERDVPGRSPDWVARRESWDQARRAYRAARWSAPLPEIARAFERGARAESSYIASLEIWAMGAGGASERVSASPLNATFRLAALDLIERGRTEPADRLLNGPLRGDRATLPLRARLVGLRVAPDSGLALLGWPPDRRVAANRPIAWDAMGRTAGDDARPALLVAAELADSAGEPRAQRAALWALVEAASRPAGRSYARVRLARTLVDGAEPGLAEATLSRVDAGTEAERFLLATLHADLAAARGDTLGSVRRLVDGVTSDLSRASRYPLARRALAVLTAARVDSLEEPVWIALVRGLGDLGEGEDALSLLRRRRVAPRDTAAALQRAETEASLLARIRRHPEAATAYERLLRRREPSREERARFALGLARSRRTLDQFAAMDSAFRLAASLDSMGSTGGQAAWERAREWEDERPPREAAGILGWARSYTRDSAVLKAIMAHRVVAWLRAGEPDSAAGSVVDSFEDVRGYWRAQIAFARGDTAGALVELRAVPLGDPWTYEGVRAREELTRRGAPPPQTVPRPPAAGETPSWFSGPGALALNAEPPLDARLWSGVGATELMMDALRACAAIDADPKARACTDGLEARGIFRVGRPSNVPAERLEYPPAYPADVFEAAERETLSAALLFAVMRQESGYLRFARSRAGAIGLLQLLPSTASQLYGSPVTEASLTEPALNVTLGARYLRGLLREFGDPRAAIAAYNAGEDAVRGWVRARPVVDDIWVELIPYRETRDYVKQVYSIWRRYEALYDVPAGSAGR